MLVRGTAPVVNAWPFDDDWSLGQHRLDVQRIELAAVKRPEIAEAAIGIADQAVTEIILAAGIKTQILSHLSPPRLEEPDQPAIMIEVPVTEDQRVHYRRVDLQQLQIVA